MLAQRTIRNKTSASGVGLHTGVKATLTLHPADPDTGILFRRKEGNKVTEIPAQANFVGDTTLSTTLEHGGAEIATIEHLMSALAGVGVDNCIIDCDGPEIPIMEGSSTRFVFLIQAAGIVEQSAVIKFIYVTKSVQVQRDDAVAKIKPYKGFRVSFGLEFDHPVYKKYPQTAAIDLKPGSATKPFYGIKPEILDKDGKVLKGEAQGRLCIAQSWPGQMRSVYGDHNRFIETYFSQFDGKYFTGDGCRRDKDGYYWITGRVDDVITVSYTHLTLPTSDLV